MVQAKTLGFGCGLDRGAEHGGMMTSSGTNQRNDDIGMSVWDFNETHKDSSQAGKGVTQYAKFIFKTKNMFSKNPGVTNQAVF